MSDKIDWTTLKQDAPTTTVQQNIGNITSSRAVSFTKNGWLIGKAVTFTSGSSAFLCLGSSLNNSRIIGGIPYNATGVNIQVGFCIPVYSGMSIYFSCSGTNQGVFEGVSVMKNTND